MAADHGVGPSTTTCDRPAHLLAPSHLVAVTIFTAGLVAWPYWQLGIAECWGVGAGRAQRTLRALPIIGPFVLARDAAKRASDPVVTLRLQIDLIAVMLLQVAYTYVVGYAIVYWSASVGTFDSWNGVSSVLRHLTYVWYPYALVLIAAISAIFMSDVQAEVREAEPRCADSDLHLYAHLSINFIAVVGALAILTTLLSMHGNHTVLALTTLVAVFAYVNGSRQRSGYGPGTLLRLRLWAHTAARHGGLVAGIVLIAISVLLFNWMFDVNESAEQGFGIGVFVDPRLLRPAAHEGYTGDVAQICASAVIPCAANELPIVQPDLVSPDRVALKIDVPMRGKGSFAFAITKFRADVTDEGLSSDRVLGAALPACLVYGESGESRPVPLFEATLIESDGTPQAVFIGEPVVRGAVEIRCSFADAQPDVLTSTYTRRVITFASCCVDDGILPPDLYRNQSEVRIDLHNFLANRDVALFGGRVDRRSPFDQRVRILSSVNSREVRDSPAQRELTVQWTERKTAESRDFTLIVSASLLGVALVCILEWLRPRIEKFGHRRPPHPARPRAR